LIKGAAMARGSIAAILAGPPLAWGTFLFMTSQSLREPSEGGVVAVIAIFLTSVVITTIGIGAIAIPLTALAARVFPTRPEIVLLCTSAIGLGLAWLVMKQEGPVVDFATLIGFHIAFAAIIFSGVCLLTQRRFKNG
jgi:hypothetical protein